MTDFDAALVEQFLYVSVTQGKSVVQPDSMLDDGHWESVAVGLEVGHGGSAYPNPIKATQPLDLLQGLGMQEHLDQRGKSERL